MYVCMHVCIYVCMYACMYACMYVCMYVCMCVCVLCFLCANKKTTRTHLQTDFKTRACRPAHGRSAAAQRLRRVCAGREGLVLDGAEGFRTTASSHPGARVAVERLRADLRVRSFKAMSQVVSKTTPINHVFPCVHKCHIIVLVWELLVLVVLIKKSVSS